jgi:molybdenum cofactor biosynthesis enzyme MoaA
MFQRRRSEYGQTKVFHHFDRLEKIRRGEYLDVVPVSIELDVTNYCPHQCFYCYEYNSAELGLNWALHRSKDVTHFDRASELLFECAEAGVKAVEYCGRGEPFAYSRFTDLLHVTHRAGLQAGIITSGSLLDEKASYAVLDSEVTWLRFSFDSLCEDTFNLIRKPRNTAVGRDAVLHNITRLSEILAKGNGHTRLSASTVVLPENFREVTDLAKFTKGIGMEAHVFRLVNLKDRDDLYEPIWDDVRAALEAAQAELEDDTFAVHLPPMDFYMRNRKPYNTCHFTLLDMPIDVNFNVYGCLETIFNPDYLIGNVGPGKSTFRQILRSPRRLEIMSRVAKCPACCRDEVNILLEGFAGVIHPNFV